MIALKCRCGGNRFTVHKLNKIIRCEKCFQKQVFENEWREFNPIREKISRALSVIPKAISCVEIKEQAISQWLKEHGIEKYRPGAFQAIRQLRAAAPGEGDSFSELTRKNFWEEELSELEARGEVFFQDNKHKGKLRGAHIAKAFKKYLNRNGVDSELSFTHDKAVVRKVAG